MQQRVPSPSCTDATHAISDYHDICFLQHCDCVRTAYSAIIMVCIPDFNPEHRAEHNNVQQCHVHTNHQAQFSSTISATLCCSIIKQCGPKKHHTRQTRTTAEQNQVVFISGQRHDFWLAAILNYHSIVHCEYVFGPAIKNSCVSTNVAMLACLHAL